MPARPSSSATPITTCGMRVSLVLGLALLLQSCVIPGPGVNITVTTTIDSRALELARLGPAIVAHIIRRFEMDAVFRGAWPFVVRYQLDGEPALLEITFRDVEPVRIELEPTGGEPRVLESSLPKKLGRGLVTGRVSVTTAGARGGPAPESLRLLGLGCGPEAVGSINVEDVNFRDDLLDLSSQDEARTHYRPLGDFDHAQVELFRREESDEGLRSVPVRQLPLRENPPRGRSVLDTWDGLDEQGEASKGWHVFQVRIWNEVREGGDKGASWIVATSESQLEVR